MATSSLMVPLGTSAPTFELPSVDGFAVALSDLAGPALLVMFLCNHCPYVRHIETALAATLTGYTERGLAAVGICSNDADAYPDDAPDRLAQQARRAGFTFPYLVDASQQTAKAYRAACTPDFFLYDAERKLAYRGAFDGPIDQLHRELTHLVHEDLGDIEGVDLWHPNDVSVQRYAPNTQGISPHLDSKRYVHLIAIFTTEGSALFRLCKDRSGPVLKEWGTTPGSLVLMRAPGFAGLKDGRPFHTVEGPRTGSRYSVTFRMDSQRGAS